MHDEPTKGHHLQQLFVGRFVSFPFGLMLVP